MFLWGTLPNLGSRRFRHVTREDAAVTTSAEETAVSTPDEVDAAGPGTLGARVRQLRRARGLTLTQLAASAGLTHGFLSKLERGLAGPSIASLNQIALALGTSQVELLAGRFSDSPAVQVQRAGEGMSGPYGLGRARLLTEGDRRLQPMAFYGDNTDPGEYYEHAEDEFIHVTEGSVLVDLGPQGTFRLSTGDSIYLAGGVPHRWAGAVEGSYRLFIVKEGTLGTVDS
jgi:transcriptional regulator with XRE-family HTH domain